MDQRELYFNLLAMHQHSADGRPSTSSKKVDRINRNILLTSSYRNYITSTSGRLGLGPAACKPGDVVVVVYNAPVPFVFRQRPESENFEFVGECYVHGLMDAEALDLVDRGELEAQKFVVD